ncbi:hypothetical protein ES703_124275 [subsurface metagenome]
MRCDFCFKEKAGTQPPLPKVAAKVCKGCFYEIDRVVGFLEHYGCQVMTQGTLAVPKRKSKASKEKTQDIVQDNP